MEYIAIGVALFAFGWWLGHMTTKHPDPLKMFDLIVEDRAERLRKSNLRETVEKDIQRAVAAKLSE